MMAILGVEANVIYKVHATANHIARCKSWSIRLAGSRRAERMSVVAVVAIRLLVPTCTAAQAYTLHLIKQTCLSSNSKP